MYPELCTIVADKNDVGCRVGVSLGNFLAWFGHA